MESLHNTSIKVKDSSSRKEMASDYVKNIKLQVEELVLIKFPQIALQLDELFTVFNISDIRPAHKKLKLVPESNSRNPDIDEFISNLQKLTVASLSNRTDHVQCNECTGDSDNFHSSDLSSVHNERKILVRDVDLHNHDIDECFSKIEKLGDASDSPPNNFDNVQYNKRSADANNFNTDVSAHNELKTLIKDPENCGVDECFSKVSKLRATSDSVLNHFDNVRCKKRSMDAIYFNSDVSEHNERRTRIHPAASNSDTDECFSEIEKLRATYDSVPNYPDYIGYQDML